MAAILGECRDTCSTCPSIGTFNRLNYDNCAYDKKVKESVTPLSYQMSRYKFENCARCTYNGKQYAPFDLVEEESELRGISRSATKCQTGSYSPTCEKSSTCWSTYDKNVPIVYPPDLCPVVCNNIKQAKTPGYVLERQEHCTNSNQATDNKSSQQWQPQMQNNNRNWRNNNRLSGLPQKIQSNASNRDWMRYQRPMRQRGARNAIPQQAMYKYPQQDIVYSPAQQETVYGPVQRGTMYGTGQSQETVYGTGQSQGTVYGTGQSQETMYGTGQSQGTVYGTGQSQGTVYGTGQSQETVYGTGQQQEQGIAYNQELYPSQTTPENMTTPTNISCYNNVPTGYSY